MALGTLKLKLRGKQYYTVTGGPFKECPSNMKGVKMAKEINLPCEVDIPTVDFQTPDKKVLAKGLEEAVDLILAGEPLYVGCFAGKGRTGLFMAILARAFGGTTNGVKYVRANYYPHAVETEAQYKFVMKFSIPKPVQRKIKRARRWAFLKFWKTNLTRLPKAEIKQDLYRDPLEEQGLGRASRLEKWTEDITVD